jgi:hypothetical protein
MDSLRRLVNEACRGLPVGLHRLEDIRWELTHHLDDTVRELEAAGMTRGDAIEQAAMRFGDPAEVRAQLIESIQGGPGAMWRRVIVPALLITSGLLLLQVAGYGVSAFNRYWVDSGLYKSWPFPLMVPLSWLPIPVVFAGCWLCGARGGTQKECIIVGFSPLLVAVPLVAYPLMTLGFGSTVGAALVRSGYIGALFQFIGECGAGTVLYLIAFHRRMTALSPAPQLFSPAGKATDSAAEASPTSP